jgi:hypothetical protein
MNTSKYYNPDQEVWDFDKQRHIIEGVYNFYNTKNFTNEILDKIGLTDGTDYALVYERNKGWPIINLIIVNKNIPNQIRHRSWSCYITSMPEHEFDQMVDFLTK